MENVLVDVGSTISTDYNAEKIVQPLKRHVFVFITAEPDLRKSVFEDLKKVENVTELYLSRGAYDIIAKVSGESLEHLREVVSKQITNLDTIKSTLALTIV